MNARNDEPITVPTEEEIRKVRGQMIQRPIWQFKPWQTAGDNLLMVGNRVLCKVPMKYELECAAYHAEVACNALPWLVAEIDRLRATLKDFAEGDCSYGDGCPVFGSRHGRCTSCVAREAIAPRPTSPLSTPESK